MGIKEVKEPSIKLDEVLLEVKACGICGSDIHLLPQEVDEETVDDVIRKIRELCFSKTIGAGKILVLPAEDVVRIRTANKM